MTARPMAAIPDNILTELGDDYDFVRELAGGSATLPAANNVRSGSRRRVTGVGKRVSKLSDR